MLMLSRKRGEKVMIGQIIELTVLEVSGDRVHIGIQAPIEIPIHREEILQRNLKTDVSTREHDNGHQELLIDASSLY